MIPDRSNYEIWIIDWLDGKLDEKSADMLMSFLEANPDLKEEADSLYISQLASGSGEFIAKDSLKKTARDLPLSQAELLSVAYLENDISPEQLSDLRQFTDLSPANKQVFDTIQKIKLVPPELVYKNKNSLKKETKGAKVIRLAAIGLSAAAAVAVLTVSYIFLNRYSSVKIPEDEQVAVTGSYPEFPFEVRTRVFVAPAEEPAGEGMSGTIGSVSPGILLTDNITNGQISVPVAPDTSQIIRGSSSPEIRSIPVSLMPEIMTSVQGQYLATTNNSYNIVSYDEDRSRLGRFIARNFREKILKEPVLNDAPLKSYEIAAAGIEGLNKLLGWDMALVRNNDEEGELKSIYFSSRFLKFNAPVKKPEPVL